MIRPSVAAARAAAMSTGGGIGNRPGGRDRNSAYPTARASARTALFGDG